MRYVSRPSSASVGECQQWEVPQVRWLNQRIILQLEVVQLKRSTHTPNFRRQLEFPINLTDLGAHKRDRWL